MSEPMFSCRNQDCAEEVSYPASMLHQHPEGGPVCRECWEHEGPHWVDGNGGGDSDETVEWLDLPAFVPEYQQRITTLESTLRTTRWHVSGIFGESHPVVIAIDKALSEGPGKETTEGSGI